MCVLVLALFLDWGGAGPVWNIDTIVSGIGLFLIIKIIRYKLAERI